MNAIIYTYSDMEYESIKTIIEDQDMPIEVSRAPLEGHKSYYDEYDIVIVGLKGAEGMEVVLEYSQRYKNSRLIWISDDEHFAGTALRAHIYDFIVRPYEKDVISKSILEAIKTSPGRNQWNFG